MERTLSQEERIRRAEELYYRKRNAVSIPRTREVSVNSKKNYKLLKKIIVQILVCVGIYLVIYNLQSKSDNLSVDSINYLKNTMAYDVDLEEYWNKIKNYIYSFIPPDENKDKQNENIVPEETLSASDENVEANEVQELPVEEPTKDSEETSSVSQMEQDAEYIKNNFSLIKPITGTITSRFGLRNPTTPTVPKYHTGIDIAVPEGTVYVAAMEGTVELVSSEGDYRNTCKNNKWRYNDSICTL